MPFDPPKILCSLLLLKFCLLALWLIPYD
jgi:hypothetical protein